MFDRSLNVRLAYGHLTFTYILTSRWPHPYGIFENVSHQYYFNTYVIFMNSYDNFRVYDFYVYDDCSIIRILKKRCHSSHTSERNCCVFIFFLMRAALLACFIPYRIVYRACSVYNNIVCYNTIILRQDDYAY